MGDIKALYSAVPDEIEADQSRLELAHLKDTFQQTTTFRSALFKHILILAYGCTAASIGMVIVWFVYFPPPPAAVGVALITGLTVEVIGLIAIMARSLFPSDGLRSTVGTNRQPEVPDEL
ncbi:hypothetical protein [Stomatohabitans albus]|uniref:hypothetical protein n=1 Tax=Stomatohabitans albus TaxID=3110766 RepID=UPI00300CDAB3